MKNKGIVIFLITLLSITVILLVMFLIMCLKGVLNLKNGMISFGYKSSTIVLDETFKVEDVDKIEIKQNAGDIVFKETTDENIKVVGYGENNNNLNVELDENKLIINNSHSNKINFFGSVKDDIIIYIPTDYSNTIKIENDYGNCEMIDLENATINIDSDAGNVEIGKVKNIDIKCDYGNIEIKEILNKCDIKSECGNIEIGKIAIKEDSIIKSDLGNVEIGEINDIYINAEVDLGKTNISKNNRNSEITLTIKCDCGNVTVGE